jgi:hypothetical protein
MALTKFFGGIIPFVVILGLILVISLVLLPKLEHFVPEFLDQGNVKRTTDTRKSSYAQQTNHFQMTPSPAEPIPGQETPFRVNIFNSYMV